ncbi:MAG: hypothetical protein VW226_10065 [Rhodospirillaceae bacterium]
MRGKLIAHVSEINALALWLLGFISFFSKSSVLHTCINILILSFALISFGSARRSIKILILIILTSTLWLASGYGVFRAIWQGLERASIFPAFLATLVLLRGTADRRPETSLARQAFSSLPANQRAGGIVTGAHFIGAILQVGVFSILAPIVGRNASEAERREVFLIAARGMALVPFWSPFIVGMAIASEYLPDVPLWQPVCLGLALTAIGLLTSSMIMDREFNPLMIGHALKSLGPIIPGVFLTAALVIVTSTVTGWSTLQSLVVSLPVPCLIGLLGMTKENSLSAVTSIKTGIGRIGPEVTLMTCAITLGTVFEAAMPQSGILTWLQSLDLTEASVIFIVIMCMNIAGLLGIHAIVPGTILLVIFVNINTGLADLVLMQALLVGWGLCTLISLGSLTIITGSVMFNLDPLRVITLPNIGYAFGLGTFCGTTLYIINLLLMT